MEPSVYQFLIHKTNEKIVTENIHPYAYQCISRTITDIRSYDSDMKLMIICITITRDPVYYTPI